MLNNSYLPIPITHITDSNISIRKSTAGIYFLPVLPVLFFFLFNSNRFRDLIFTRDVFLLLLAYCTFAIILPYLLRKLLKLTSIQAVITACLVIIIFIFFGSIQDALLKYNKNSFAGKGVWLVLLLASVLTIVIIYFKKKRPLAARFQQYLLWLFILLNVFESVKLIVTFINGKSYSSLSNNMTRPVLQGTAYTMQETPDIYYIVFDGYTNKAALQEHWQYDNEIYSFLSNQGFFTADSAFSNYNFTPYSISSVFNLQYLVGAEPYLERNAANFYTGLLSYRENHLFNFLKKQGYKLSIFSLLNDTRYVTALGNFAPEKPVTWLRKQTLERIYLNPWIMHKLRQLWGKKSELPAAVLKSLQFYAQYNMKAMDHVVAGCQNLKVHVSASPVFSYTHFMLPHGPYVFDENGQVSLTVKDPGNDMQDYLVQLKYANKLIRQITQCLLTDSTRKKIIVIQGDHGYRSYPNESQYLEYEALNAFYFYNKKYTGLKKDLSHVNTFRVVANNFFNAGLPLLKDSIVLMKKN